jgi:hypothetical protein
VDPEPFQARLDGLSDEAGGPVAEDRPGIGPWRGRLRPHVVGHLSRQLLDVVAVVAVVGDRLAPPEGGDRRAEVRDLAADVVEVVLARHPLPACLQHPAQEVADERATRVADVQRAGRVR